MAKTFTYWLQERLVHHGYRIGVDGVLGNETTAALKNFQRAKGFPASGTADMATVEALRKDRDGKGQLRTPPPAADMPPWLEEMTRRMNLHERRDNKALSEWLRIGKYLGNPAKLPWCGDAIETCIVKTLPDEPVPNNPFWARNWADFGIEVGAPIVGAIGVIGWKSGSGHVGIVIGYDRKRRLVHMRGGNQSDMIKDSAFHESDFIAYTWPKTFRVQKYPAIIGRAVAVADLQATR